jgi:hypothetical protein
MNVKLLATGFARSVMWRDIEKKTAQANPLGFTDLTERKHDPGGS